MRRARERGRATKSAETTAKRAGSLWRGGIFRKGGCESFHEDAAATSLRRVTIAATMRWVWRSIMSLALLVALALSVLCVRSFWRNDSLFIERGPRGYFVASVRGRVGVIEVSGQQWHPRRFHFASYERTHSAVLSSIVKSPDTKDLFILLSGSGKLPGNFGQSRWIAFPYLTPLIPCAAVSITMLTRVWRRRRRSHRGLCGQCGYDLRASSGRCPECGCEAPGRDVSTQAGAMRGVRV